MTHSILIRRTYKYRLYRNDKRDAVLHRHITIAGAIWNHALKLQKRYYRLTGNYIHDGEMKAHLADAYPALCMVESPQLSNRAGRGRALG